MGSSFKYSHLSLIFLIGALTVGLVLAGVQRLSVANESTQAETQRLFRLSDVAHELLDSVIVISSAGAPSVPVSESDLAMPNSLLVGVSTARSELLRLAAKDLLATEVSRLDAVVGQWIEEYIDLVAEPKAERGTRALALKEIEIEIAEHVHSLSHEARLKTARVVKAEHSRAISTIWLLCALWIAGSLAAINLLHARNRDLLLRARSLPGRLEKSVFDREESALLAGDPSDPVNALTREFEPFAKKVREKLRENEKVERLAFTDSLTGLPNRRGLLAFLDGLAEKDEIWKDDQKIGLIHLDLDHFKTINDTMGHDAGDMVLREATKRMSTGIRDSDLLARLGGDEFLVVATGLECEADLTIIADRLLAQFEAPMTYLHRVCHVGISMGLVLGGQRGRVRDPKRLLISADMALFRAKSEGRSRYAVFTSAMAEEARRQNERSIALSDALHCDAFRPWFQPMIDLHTNRVVGLELLARWHDPVRGVLMPNEFIEDAESISLMEEIGFQVLDRTLDSLRKWRAAALQVPTIHLNLSRTQLLSSSFVDRFSWALDEANVAPGDFAVEVDERDCGTRGSEVAIANVGRLRAMGVEIVLDNFGADHAALSNIRPLGARCVKCSPETLTKVFGEQSRNAQIRVLSALQAGAEALGIVIRGNGVETSDQSTVFSEANILIQQGDHLAPVMDAEQTADFLESGVADLRKVS